MKTTLTLLLSLLLGAAALMAGTPDLIVVPLSPPQKESVDFVVSKVNADALAKHMADQSSKPEAERNTFVPITEEAYLQARFADVLASYREAYVESRKDDEENKALFEAVINADPVKREAIKAQVAAALAK